MLQRFIAIYLLLLVFGCAKVIPITESSETLSNWHKAREYQSQERYELAQQYYLLALASSRDPQSQQALKREIKVIERMIQTMR